MGNCFAHHPSMRDHHHHQAQHHNKSRLTKKSSSITEESLLLGREQNLISNANSSSSSSSTSSSSAGQVRIKITKKQLEGLLKSVEMQGISLEQGLLQLINVKDMDEFCSERRTWTPVLHSIPE